MNRQIVRRTVGFLVLAAVIGLASCKRGEEAAAIAPATPTGSIDAAVASLKSGDLKALFESQVPPKHLERMRAEWTDEIAKEEISEEDRREFDETMARLLAADAEAQLMAELEPQLVKFETEIAPQMPMMIGMGRGLAMSGIQESKDLSPEQKQQAIAGLDALAKWVQETKFSDRELARKAIAHLTASAREMKLETIDDVRALSFDEALARGSVALKGAKQVLAVYGLSLDETLNSVKTEVLSETGDQARVRVSYSVFGQPVTLEIDMVKVDGRWYGKKGLAELDQAVTKASEPDASEDEPAAATTGS
jgi:hypothetical protein